MKKLILLIFTIVSVQALAQRKEEDPYTSRTVSIGPEILVPGQTDFKYGISAKLRVEYPFTDLVSFIGSVSYTRLYYKNAIINEKGPLGAYTAEPIKAGARFFLTPDLYTDIEFGAAIGNNYDKINSLALAFNIGYVIPVNKSTGVDASVGFEDWGKDRLRGLILRAAYRIPW
jgi:hypothetical protein